MPSSTAYAQLPRKDLMVIAKQRGIPANKATMWLCDELARLDAGGKENQATVDQAFGEVKHRSPGKRSRQESIDTDQFVPPSEPRSVIRPCVARPPPQPPATGSAPARRRTAPAPDSAPASVTAPTPAAPSAHASAATPTRATAAAPSSAAASSSAAAPAAAPLDDLGLALEQLLGNQGGPFHRATGTLLKVIGNILKSPDEAAYRALRTGTATFQTALSPAAGAISALTALGFAYEDEADGRYALRGTPDVALLRRAERALRELPADYERRSERLAEEAMARLADLRFISKANRKGKDEKAQSERAKIVEQIRKDREERREERREGRAA